MMSSELTSTPERLPTSPRADRLSSNLGCSRFSPPPWAPVDSSPGMGGDPGVIFHTRLHSSFSQDEQGMVSRKGNGYRAGWACVLSANRCRAAWRDTPRAIAIWFHDLPCARAMFTVSRSCASPERSVSDIAATWRRSSVRSTSPVSGSSSSASCSKRRAACSISSFVCCISFTPLSEEPVELRS